MRTRGLIMIHLFTTQCFRCNFPVRGSQKEKCELMSPLALHCAIPGIIQPRSNFFLKDFNWQKNTTCLKKYFNVTRDLVPRPKTLEITNRPWSTANGRWNMNHLVRSAGWLWLEILGTCMNE